MHRHAVLAALVSLAACQGVSHAPEDHLLLELPETATWDLTLHSTFWILADSSNDLPATRDIESLKGESNRVYLDSYELRFDWGEDLAYDLGPGSDPWELGITDRYRDAISVTIPPGGRCVESLQLSAEVGVALTQTMFWSLEPTGTTTEFTTFVTLFGTTAGGHEAITSSASIRITVGDGFGYAEPPGATCCTALPAEFPEHSFDAPVDCRLNRPAYDALHPPAPWTSPSGEVVERSQCCPEWPDYCL